MNSLKSFQTLSTLKCRWFHSKTKGNDTLEDAYMYGKISTTHALLSLSLKKVYKYNGVPGFW